CRFPGNPEVRWDFARPPLNAFWNMDDKTKGEQNDSCVTLYWPEEVMPARTKRAMAFSYGLGRFGLDPSQSALRLTVPGKPVPGREFSVIAWVKNPQGQQVTLELPAGMSLATGQPDTQAVARSKTELGQVSWRVKVAEDARPQMYTISAHMPGARASVKVP